MRITDARYQEEIKTRPSWSRSLPISGPIVISERASFDLRVSSIMEFFLPTTIILQRLDEAISLLNLEDIGSWNAQTGLKPAMRLSRKDWHFAANRAVLWPVPGDECIPGSCPAGVMAEVGLRWWRRWMPQNRRSSRCRSQSRNARPHRVQTIARRPGAAAQLKRPRTNPQNSKLMRSPRSVSGGSPQLGNQLAPEASRPGLLRCC